MEVGNMTNELPVLVFAAAVVVSIFYTRSRSQQSSHGSRYDRCLSNEEIQEFNERGVLVIKNVLSSKEVALIRRGFHDFLAIQGVDVNDLEGTALSLSKLSSTGGAGGILDVFYADWKLPLNEHPVIVNIMMSLWEHTYAKCEGIYKHPFGAFDARRGYMYIDRVCFRVPDTISRLFGQDKKHTLQRSLTPHIDCCPHRLYEDVGDKKYSKWRPIQAFIPLTDTLEKNVGGFEACPGLHAEFDDWTKRRLPSTVSLKTSKTSGSRANDSSNDRNINTATYTAAEPEPPCVGHFTPIRPKEDKDVIDRFEHIPCQAGDLVLWDYRIPHANAYRNDANTAREVVYVGFLPDVPVNKEYAQKQLERMRAGMVPDDQWHEHVDRQQCSCSFSELGKRLMGIESWN